MLRSAAVALMKQGLGFRKSLDDACVASLKEAQAELELGGTLPWFLIEKDYSLPILTGVTEVDLPEGWLRVVEDEAPYFTDTDLGISYIKFRPYDELKTYYQSVDADRPKGLALRNNSLAVFPVPDADYTLTLSYYKAAETLDADIENVWLAQVPYLLVARAGMLLAADLEYSAATAKFTAKYDMWRLRYLSEIATREDQNNPRAMGANS